MKLIVGLGNPGPEYAGTRHNAGFLVVDRIAETQGARWKMEKIWSSECATTQPGNGTVILLCKPQTFMNRSGDAVRELLKAKKLAPHQLLLIYDDADLPFGKIVYRPDGSSAGHNGVQSILDQFPEAAVPRVRIGIGRPENPNVPLEDWVLERWSAEEAARLPEIIDEAVTVALGHL
jgi:PTH1 family peptidyl-tRNA hydrolase